MPPALLVRDLRKTFRAGAGACVAHVDVLRGADLTVREGELVALAGGAGTGKSTLLLCAAGLLRADSGTVVWFGRRAAAGAPADTAYLGPHVTARAPGDLARAVREASRSLGAPPLRLLLVDEPADADAGGARLAAARLAALADEGAAVVAACRDPSALRAAGARVVRLEGGRTITETGRAVRVARSLELRVRAPASADRLLGARLPGVVREGDVVRVPLDGRSAEEVLAHCLALRIVVHASRVVSVRAPHDAQGGSVASPSRRS